MARLDMDFAVRYSRPRLALVALAMGLAGSLHAIWLRDDLLSRREAQQDEIRRLERSLSHHQFSAVPSVRQNPKAVAETMRLVTELQRPWEAMLNSLQKAAQPDILIMRIQPESNARRLLITGQANDNQAFLSYVTRLRSDASWRSVVPVSEERSVAAIMQGDKPVSFQLMAEWGAE